MTQVDKANVLATSRLWRKVTDEVHADFPDVELEHRLVDSAAMVLARWPAGFDVLVDREPVRRHPVGRGGGDRGLAGPAAVGVARDARDGARPHGLYEPIHGSAPDIAGQDLANPLGTILSAAMLLALVAGQAEAAAAIEEAVERRARRRLPDDGPARRPTATRPP